MTGGTIGLVLSLAMLAVFALAAGGTWLIAHGGHRRRGALMLVMALVLLANVLILAWPGPSAPPSH